MPWTGWQLWSGWLPAARGHSQTVPPLRSSAWPPGRATGLSPGGWSPVTPTSLHPDASAGSAGPGPPGQLPPVSALSSYAVRQAASFSTLFRAPLFPPAQDDQSGPQELPRAHLQCASGRRADEGAARWVPGPGLPPRAQQARLPASLAWPPSAPLARGPLHVRKQARRGRVGLLPGAGTRRPSSRRILRAGPPPDAPTLASVREVLMLLCWAFLIPSC